MTTDSKGGLVLRSICFVLAALLISQLFYLGRQPFAAGLFQPPWDLVAHFLTYSALTALLWAAAAGRMPLAVLAVVVIIGGLDELYQSGLPGRVADAADFLVNVSAATFTCALMLLVDALRKPDESAWVRPAGR
jgi:VanZ family protein